ncbi:MAG: VCBS repeat-containing protein, partial [Ignavibacteriae bacterium]|nr:VCBS repeat-containing protein [Ignavibacteriota bacterium]
MNILFRICLMLFLLEQSTSSQELKWRLYPSPTTANLDRIKMLSSSVGFIVSEDSGLFEYDGKRWKRFLPSLPGKINRAAFDATSRTDIWCASLGELDQHQLYHFDGENWRRVYIGENAIISISFTSRGLGMISGISSIALYDGRTFQLIAPPTINDISQAIAVAPEEYFVFESNAPNGRNRLFRYHKNVWQAIREFPHGVRPLSFESPSRLLLLLGDTLFHFQDYQWEVVSIDTIIREIHSLSMVNKQDIWALRGVNDIVRFNGGKWTSISIPAVSDLQSIAMISSEEGWAVGANGIILHYSRTDSPLVTFTNLSQVSLKKLFQAHALGKLDVIGQEDRDEYGVAIADVNGDERLDIFTVAFSLPNRLYMNNWRIVENPYKWMAEEADGRGVQGLSSMTQDRPANQTLQDIGCAFADIDNNATQDLFVTGYSMFNEMYINDGDGYFIEGARDRGVAGDSLDKSNAAIFGDVNNDGNLDLFVTNHVSSNRLYLGNGTGKFTEVTDSFNLRTERGGQGAVFGDVNGDGFIDLYVANWSLRNYLYLNQQGRKFDEMGESAGVAGEPFWKSQAPVLFDVENDGDLDLFVTNRVTSNRLYLNNGTGTFHDATNDWGLRDSAASYGTIAGDFDNDGDLDLVVANIGPNVYYRNEGDRFIDATREVGVKQHGYNTGIASCDIDADGDLDF